MTPKDSSGQAETEFDSVESLPLWNEQPTQIERSIRHSELATSLDRLENNELLLIRKEPGSRASGFLAALVAEFQIDNANASVFHIDCSGVTSGEELQMLLAASSNHTITELGAELRDYGICVIVLDELAQSCRDKPKSTVDETIASLIDFCPDLKIIWTSSLPFAETPNEIIIGALSAPDTKVYLDLSMAENLSFDSAIDYTRIHRVTGGLPYHLDGLVQALAVADLDEALAQVYSIPNVKSDQLPKQLVEYVNDLKDSPDGERARSRMLLWFLSLLDRGETLAAVKRIDPTQPIWPKHANELLENGCLNVVDPKTNKETFTFSKKQSGDKVLRVPRLVRDFVIDQMTTEESKELTISVANLYFATDWRNGIVRMRRRVAFGNGISTQQSGNEMTIFRLISKSPDLFFDDATRFYNLGLSYISQLIAKGFYGEAFEAAREFLGYAKTLPVNPDRQSLTKLRTFAAVTSRMIGQRQSCMDYLNLALPDLRAAGNKKNLSSALVDYGLAAKGLGKDSDARIAAEEILSTTQKETSDWFQAKGILAQLEPDKAARLRKLKPLATRARNLKHFTAADNLTLEIVSDSDNTEEKLKLLALVKSRGERQYNYVRATIRRVETLLDSNRANELTEIDHLDLWRSYNLAFSQNLSGIFDWCHRVCWEVMIETGETKLLAELLLYSSFLWRLNGNNASEAIYLLKLGQLGATVGVLGSVKQYVTKRMSALNIKL